MVRLRGLVSLPGGPGCGCIGCQFETDSVQIPEILQDHQSSRAGGPVVHCPEKLIYSPSTESTHYYNMTCLPSRILIYTHYQMNCLLKQNRRNT